MQAHRNWSRGALLRTRDMRRPSTSGGLEQILGAVNELAPSLAGAEILETWSGLRPGTPDQLPILGPTDMEGLMIATGHYRNGILLAPVTSKLIMEMDYRTKSVIGLRRFQPFTIHTRPCKSLRDSAIENPANSRCPTRCAKTGIVARRHAVRWTRQCSRRGPWSVKFTRLASK